MSCFLHYFITIYIGFNCGLFLFPSPSCPLPPPHTYTHTPSPLLTHTRIHLYTTVPLS
ncbi:hypothetical protein BCR39DRAFT_549624 [Naematelia encephala]|uniref:Uncharacterized protein n=1 Tax=Naematelia encephala TaxID=71784 RepID=A0A1Y2AL18_9TREE|nr:hypothetical protein BCR39DRAFT_549624 [Naematelia encephala]